MEHTIAYHVASLVQAIENCRKSGNTEWESRHARRLAVLLKQYMPSGSGWDMGTKFDIDASTEDKLVFTGGFHHMDDSGYYVGWTAHRITARPLFDDVALTISGSNRNDIKDYLYDMFHAALTQRIDKATADAHGEVQS